MKKGGKSILFLLIIALFFTGIIGIALKILLKQKTSNNESAELRQKVQKNNDLIAIADNDFSILGETPAAKSEYDSIAEKTLDCIDTKLKNDQGFYYSNILCVSDGCKSQFSNRASTPPIWAKFKYFLKFQDKQMLESLLTDALSVKEGVHTIQNVSFNCKYVAEIYDDVNLLYKNELITEEQKELLTTNLCFDRNIYYFSEIPGDQAERISQAPLEIDLVALKTDLESSDNKDFNFILTNNDPGFLGYLPSEYIARYKMTNDPEEIKKANFFLEQALELLKEKKSDFGLINICMLGEGSLDYYRLTQKEQFLQLSELIFDIFNLEPEFLKQARLDEQTACIQFLYGLSKITDNEKYSLYTNQLVDNILNNYLYNEKPDQAKNECFEEVLSPQNPNNRGLSTRANSLIVDLLLKIEKE